MTREEALFEFFNSFGIPGYPTGSVPYETQYPWLTYDAPEGNWGDSSTQTATIDLWYHTESNALPNAKADEIRQRIGIGGCLIHYEGGAIWLKRGTPWCNTIVDSADDAIKRRQLNIEIEDWQ